MTAAPHHAPLALVGASLIDGDGGPSLDDAVVVVDGASIQAVGRRGQVEVPHGATTVDLRGKVLLPGLIDAHVHAETDWAMAALLAAGVTQIRNPARSPADAPLPIEGAPCPAMLAAGGAIDLVGSQVLGVVHIRDEGELRATIRSQVDAGVDFVKLYMRLGPELVRAAVQEAHALGVKVMGDLARTSWLDAAHAGIDFIAHAAPRHASLLPAAVRHAFEAEVAARAVHPIWRWYELVDLDGPEIDQLIDVLATREVVVDPTLVTLEAMLFEGDPRYRAQLAPALASLPADSPIRSAMSNTAASQHDLLPPEPGDWPDCPLWLKVLELVQRLHEGGVRLIAGSDAPRPWVVPGVSLHRELALLVRAGLSTAQALAAATGRSAEALGIGERAGAVRPGMRADLVLLGADPLASIEGLASVQWVMSSGVRHAPANLRRRCT